MYTTRKKDDPYAHPHLPYAPMGISPKRGENIKNVKYAYQGDTIRLYSCPPLINGEPATDENSRINFKLVDDRFCRTPLFEAEWNDNLNATDQGLEIVIPKTVTCNLRRGTFLYALTISDTLGDNCLTYEEGSILIEYGANAPNPDIPYRTETDKHQNDASNPDEGEGNCCCDGE